MAPPDASPPDASPPDASPPDASPPDAAIDGSFDSGVLRDAGDQPDAFVERDAGVECTIDSECALPSELCAAVRCIEARCEASARSAGLECRAAAGECDLAEVCDGVSLECPSDDFAVGTVCRASMGMCDVAEVCGGGASCPSDSGAAAACVPSTPILYSALGRNASFTTIELNGTSSTVATVAPGAMVSLRVVGNWTDTNMNCPTCITQFYARLDGVFSLCLGSTTENATFDSTTSFVAPLVPGVYVINPVATWEFSCIGTTSAPTEFGPSSLATLVVE